MTHSLAVFFENVDNATLDNVAALRDTKYFTSGDDFRVPAVYNKIVAAYALCDTGLRAQLVSPSMLSKAPFEIVPMDVLTEPVSVPPTHDLRNNPIVLETGEALNAKSTNSGAAAVDQYVMAWLAEGPIEPIKGQEIFSIRATGSLTAVADAWTNGTLTLASDLKVGTYALVGARVEGATAIACRFIFPDDVSRPGCIGFDLNADQDDKMFRYGGMGEWGKFQHDAPPKFEILCAAADTAQTFTLDLMKVA